MKTDQEIVNDIIKAVLRCANSEEGVYDLLGLVIEGLGKICAREVGFVLEEAQEAISTRKSKGVAGGRVGAGSTRGCVVRDVVMVCERLFEMHDLAYSERAVVVAGLSANLTSAGYTLSFVMGQIEKSAQSMIDLILAKNGINS